MMGSLMVRDLKGNQVKGVKTQAVHSRTKKKIESFFFFENGLLTVNKVCDDGFTYGSRSERKPGQGGKNTSSPLPY